MAVHMTRETLDYIKSDKNDGTGDGLWNGKLKTGLCGKSNLQWTGFGGAESCVAVYVEGRYLTKYDNPKEIMKGYTKVNCPKCIEIMKAEGI